MAYLTSIDENNVRIIDLARMAKYGAGKSKGFKTMLCLMTPEQIGDFLIEIAECGTGWLAVLEKYDEDEKENKYIKQIIEGLLYTGLKTCWVLQ